jgi:hypothetical protein
MKKNNFSKKIMFLLIVVAFIIGMFASVNVKAEAPGGLYCKDLANCSGEAGCSGYGSVNGCTIDCQNGGSANCDEANPTK